MLVQAFQEWLDDDAITLGAALAYYSVLSLAPLLTVLLAIVSLFFGSEVSRNQLASELDSLLGRDVASAAESIIRSARAPAAGVIATFLGLVTLFFGASGVLSELKASLNKIWEVPQARMGLFQLLKDRLWSFAMVLGIGFILLISLVISAAMTAVGDYFAGMLPWSAAFLMVVNSVLAFCVTMVVFAALFKFLPDAPVSWRDVWVGAFGTAVLFSIGKVALAMYLVKAGVGSAYGAAGSLVALLVWVYYAAQIFFLGAEFTQVYANTHGSHAGHRHHA